MRKLKKLAVWAVVFAMIMSMLPGMALITAKAETAEPTLSETYPEATELLTYLQIMNNSEKAWTDPISSEEANTVVQKALYDSTGWGWTPATFGISNLTGETVTAAQFLSVAMPSLRWAMYDYNELWGNYFHVLRDVCDYNSTAALTREQAAQIILNIFRATPEYNEAGMKANDQVLGLTYVRTNDTYGRPTYQWYQNGNPVTAAYKAEPIAVLQGGSSYKDVMDAFGVTQEVTNTIGAFGAIGFEPTAGYVYSHSFINTYTLGAPSGYALMYHGNNGATLGYGAGWIVEVYDSYTMQTDGTFTCKAYDVYVLYEELAYVGTSGDKRTITYYTYDGNVYGPWDDVLVQAAVGTIPDGYYVIHYRETTTKLKPTTPVSATLDAFTDSTVTVGGIARHKAVGINMGKELLVDGNIGKTFTFYLDGFGHVLAIKDCAHSVWTAWKNNGEGRHVANCTSCYIEKSEACSAGALESAGSDTHVKKCTTCQAVMESAAHTLGSWTYVDATNCKKTCSDNCGYELVLPHDTEIRDAEPSSQTKPGYTGDTWCKNCNTKLATGQDIPKVDHDHIPGTPQQEDVVGADCDTPGSYNEVVYCTFTNCGEKLSSTPKTIDPLEHVPGTAVKENEEPAKCETKGGYDEVVYCTRTDCGEELSSAHKDVDPIGHKWKETGRVAASATSAGSITYTCENDATHTKTEVVPAQLEGNTSFLEAVELVLALGMADTTKTTWTENLTGAEANKMLQALYDGPGFTEAWSPSYAADATVTGRQFAADALRSIGWAYADTDLWIAYNHLYKGLGTDFSANAALTREQACQIVLNTMKAIPVYNPATIKGNDPLYGLTLVKTTQDTYGRPTYKWAKGDNAVTNEHADTPVAVLKGGSTWNEILAAIGYVTNEGVVPAVFRWTINGGELTEPVNKVTIPDDTTTLLTSEYTLEVYTDYSTDHTGFEYIIVCTSGEHSADAPEDTNPGAGTSGGDTGTSGGTTAAIPAVPEGTVYKEAVQVLIALGWLDKDADMDGNLTGAEANKILQAMYDGPGFEVEWHPDFAADATVTGKELASDILVTTGWNYNNDALFTKYNHLEKGMKSGYNSSNAITREQAAQMVLNALKSVPTYNSKSFKYLDGGIGLTHVLVKRDDMGRPYYKWQKGGVDVSDVYRDDPVVTMQGGVVWSDILSAVGDVGDINIAQMFRAIEEGGDPSEFVSRKHPDYNLFMDADYALEVYLDYTQAGTFDTYAYTVVVYEGTVSIPETGDTSEPLMMDLLCAGAAAAAYVVFMAQKKKQQA